MGDRLRARDLARSAGISVQQIRTYVETGVLPATERTAGGHRVFTAAHAEALSVAREFAVGHGWGTTRVVMRAIHDNDVDISLAAVDASHARLNRERHELAAVREALETLLSGPPGRSDHAHRSKRAGPSSGSGPAGGSGRTEEPGYAVRRAAAGSGLRIGEVARAVGVRPPVLRLWEAHGLLRPDREPSTGYRLYDSAELRAAHVVALLRRGSHPIPAIASVLEELRAAGSPDRVLRELAHRAQELHRISLRRLAASAALHGYLRYLGHTA